MIKLPSLTYSIIYKEYYMLYTKQHKNFLMAFSTQKTKIMTFMGMEPTRNKT
jgi:hypothetical protein